MLLLLLSRDAKRISFCSVRVFEQLICRPTRTTNQGPNSIEKIRPKNHLEKPTEITFWFCDMSKLPIFGLFLSVGNLNLFFSRVFKWFFSLLFFYWIRPMLCKPLTLPNLFLFAPLSCCTDLFGAHGALWTSWPLRPFGGRHGLSGQKSFLRK